jgi:lipoyl(octanoyl) transferase
MKSTPIIRRLGLQSYVPVWHDMQHFTAARTADTPDELWLVEHAPVFTVGLNGKLEHLLEPGVIEVIQVDRGGQVTYHGPGQVVLYLLLDLRRRSLGVRALVNLMEHAVIDLLADYGVSALARQDAPGVYVYGAKVASLGLRVRRGCSYHGLALNVDMELAPFNRINPCGYPGLAVTQLRALGVADSLERVGEKLVAAVAARLGAQ